MALIKVCDYSKCRAGLGGEKSFIQTKGSVSEQYEPGDGTVEFRYLTNKQDETHTFCDDLCEHGWREEMRAKREFIRRSVDGDVQVSL